MFTHGRRLYRLTKGSPGNGKKAKTKKNIQAADAAERSKKWQLYPIISAAWSSMTA